MTHTGDAEPLFSPALSSLIDHANAEFDACTDEPCRRAWRAVLIEFEALLPPGVGEPSE
jgi:hypothetical protein